MWKSLHCTPAQKITFCYDESIKNTQSKRRKDYEKKSVKCIACGSDGRNHVNGNSGDSGSGGSDNGGSSDDGGKHYKFAYTCMDGTNPFFVTIEDKIKELVEANGDELISTDPANDVSLQITQVEDMVSQNIDGIFLNPVEAEGILPALDALKSAEVPIVNFDTEVADMSYVASYTGSDNYNAGKEMSGRRKNHRTGFPDNELRYRQNKWLPGCDRRTRI